MGKSTLIVSLVENRRVDGGCNVVQRQVLYAPLPHRIAHLLSS
jgi:hypothetical protein